VSGQPFERRTTKRVQTRAATVALRRRAGAEPRLVDLSTVGLGLEAAGSFGPDEELEVELRHPSLPALALEAVVVWRRAAFEPARTRVGLELARVSRAERVALRRLLAAESGSAAFDGERLVGFVLGAAEGLWNLFDGRAVRAALVAREAGRFVVTRPGPGPGPAPERLELADLGAAIATAFGTATAPRLAPPIPGVEPEAAAAPPAPPPPPPPPAPAPTPAPAPGPATRRAKREPSAPAPMPLRGSKVLDGARVCGWVALTGEGVWSVYDDAMRQVGVLHKEGERYSVYWLGERGLADSLESIPSESFPDALAALFDLPRPPRLVSAVFTPDSRAKEAPRRKRGGFGEHRVVFRRRVVGYVGESPMPATWPVLDEEGAQVAIVTRADDRFRVCWLGATAEESLDFLDHPDFAGAVGLAFELPSEPLIDPPIPGVGR